MVSQFTQGTPHPVQANVDGEPIHAGYTTPCGRMWMVSQFTQGTPHPAGKRFRRGWPCCWP
eukprot:1286177-Prymnesium_polylepis.1